MPTQASNVTVQVGKINDEVGGQSRSSSVETKKGLRGQGTYGAA